MFCNNVLRAVDIIIVVVRGGFDATMIVCLLLGVVMSVLQVVVMAGAADGSLCILFPFKQKRKARD
jgi:hypothetical protein